LYASYDDDNNSNADDIVDDMTSLFIVVELRADTLLVGSDVMVCYMVQAEVRVDMTSAPVEEAYSMLTRYGLTYNDGNAERVDTLGYRWMLLKQQVNNPHHHPYFQPFLVYMTNRLTVNTFVDAIFLVSLHKPVRIDFLKYN
jgi:hypothetical protein